MYRWGARTTAVTAQTSRRGRVDPHMCGAVDVPCASAPSMATPGIGPRTPRAHLWPAGPECPATPWAPRRICVVRTGARSWSQGARPRPAPASARQCAPVEQPSRRQELRPQVLAVDFGRRWGGQLRGVLLELEVSRRLAWEQSEACCVGRPASRSEMSVRGSDLGGSWQSIEFCLALQGYWTGIVAVAY